MNNERYKRGYKGLYQATLLTRSGIKRSLPPSRSSLASYALEYGGALRIIRGSDFSNDLCNSAICLREGVGAGIYRLEHQS
jgi:hypothetical protein